MATWSRPKRNWFCEMNSQKISTFKTYMIAYILLMATGLLGMHRFYLQEKKTGFLLLGLTVSSIIVLNLEGAVAAEQSSLPDLWFTVLFLSAVIWWIVDFFYLPKLIAAKHSLRPAASISPESKPRLPALPREFVVFDLETTGLDPFTDQIIEIGAIKARPDSVTQTTFQVFVKIEGKVPAEIRKLTGITDKMLAGGDSLEHALKEFSEFVGDLRLVAFNAPFDMSFLKAAAEKFGMSFGNPVSDPLKMFRRAYPGLDSYKLRDLAKMLELPVSKHHRAVDDCKLTVQVYATAADKLKSHS